jgi:hypothetical protein
MNQSERSLYHNDFEESEAAWRNRSIENSPKDRAHLLAPILGGLVLIGASVSIWHDKTASEPVSTHLPAYRPVVSRYVGNMPISCQSDKDMLPNDIPSYVAEYQFAQQCYPNDDPLEVMDRMQNTSSPVGAEQPGDIIKITDK